MFEFLLRRREKRRDFYFILTLSCIPEPESNISINSSSHKENLSRTVPVQVRTRLSDSQIMVKRMNQQVGQLNFRTPLLYEFHATDFLKSYLSPSWLRKSLFCGSEFNSHSEGPEGTED
jgi:hypothetical protein